MDSENTKKVRALISKGARVPEPYSVLIGQEVPLERIAGQGVVIYPGCRIFGEKTLIMPGAELGREGPVTVENCQVGPGVILKGGFFAGSTFLEKASMGSGAQVRPGCILEEQASGAHCVGLKQTILFPFVTLGSLINFCDCLMAGGTSRANHCEVGSSYIHFNYTPNQDKATASLIGDVPRGVMLNQPPIFLGGQGGLVGPARLEYGSVVAAGIVCRNDLMSPGKLVLGQDLLKGGDAKPGHVIDFYPGVYWHVKRQVLNNVNFIANLVALRHWYLRVRSRFMQGNDMFKALHAGAVEKLDLAINERTRRLGALAQMMPESIKKYQSVMKDRTDETLIRQKQEFFERWHDLEHLVERHLSHPGDPSVEEPFLKGVETAMAENSADFVLAIQGLDKEISSHGTQWLQGIVDTINREALRLLPSFG